MRDKLEELIGRRTSPTSPAKLIREQQNFVEAAEAVHRNNQDRLTAVANQLDRIFAKERQLMNSKRNEC